jgi:hypothetical protein
MHTGFWWVNMKERITLKTWPKWQGNMKMDLKETGREGTGWAHLV